MPLLLLLLACAPDPRPDVIIYLVDTLRWDHLGAYGYGRDTSPRLDGFARDAVVYTHAYSTTSWTRPAVATLLSGVYPTVHGAVTGANAIDPEVPLLGELLQQAGYRTAAFVTNPNVLPVWGFETGFDDFYDIESVQRSGRADEVNARVFQHLAAGSPRPFFWYVHTRDPHWPYDPPPGFDDLWQKAEPKDPVPAYDGEVRFNDHHFGLLLDRLKTDGLYRDALIVFTSDHGEELKERGRVGHGQSLFEEVVRIPLVIKYPGNEGAGLRSDAPVSFIDVLPTLLAAAGREAPAGLAGVDLRTLAQDVPRALFFELNRAGGRGLHVVDGVLLGRHKLLKTAEPEERLELFDLGADPGESSDLSQAEPALAAHLGDRVDAYRGGGRAGLHLALVDPSAAAPRPAEVVLATSGRFSDPRPEQLEPGDAVRLSEDGRELELRAVLRNVPNPLSFNPKRIVDQEHLVVGLEPADAEVTVRELRVGGRPGNVYLGPGMRDAGAAPVRFGGGAAELRTRRMDTLFGSTREESVVAKPGLYVTVVEPSARREVEVDPETRARLRELGYLQ